MEGQPGRCGVAKEQWWAGLVLFFLSLLPAGVSWSAEEDAVPEGTVFTVDAYVIEGPLPISARLGQRVLAPHLGRHSDFESLDRAAAALESALHERGYAFYRVVLPPQSLDDGSVRLQVERFELESVVVEGATRYREATVRRSLPALREGESPNLRTLVRQVDAANRHPGRRTDVRFVVNEALAAHVHVAEERPLQGYAWLNNTGSPDSGETHLGVGAQYANLFRRDHVGTASYTTATRNPDDVSQYAASYRVPLYRLSSTVELFGVRSNVDAGTVAEFFEVRGRGSVLGGRLNVHLPRRGIYRQSLVLGLEDKQFENDVRFDGIPIGVDVRSRPASLGYSGDWQGDRLGGSLYATYYENLDGGRDNTEAAYGATRLGATPDWRLWRYGLALRAALGGGWALRGRLDGQYADEPLIPGEQFGLGGLDSVRGVGERLLADDRGWRAGLELWSPAAAGSLQGLVFVDGGRLTRIEPLPGERARDHLVTAGAGFRLLAAGRLSLRVDYGRVLGVADEGERADGVGRGDNRVHGSLVLRF